MKIILAPSKTKKISERGFDSKNLAITKEIVKEILSFDKESLKNMFKLNDEKISKLIDFYKTFENQKTGAAILSYQGQVYKQCDFLKEDYPYLKEHILIISALYGPVNAFDNISNYRLDFENYKKLYSIWENKVNEALEDELIINLASKEYSKIVKKEMIDIKFKNRMQIKKARGKFLNLLVKNKIKNLEELRALKEFVGVFENEYLFDLGE